MGRYLCLIGLLGVAMTGRVATAADNAYLSDLGERHATIYVRLFAAEVFKVPNQSFTFQERALVALNGQKLSADAEVSETNRCTLYIKRHFLEQKSVKGANTYRAQISAATTFAKPPEFRSSLLSEKKGVLGASGIQIDCVWKTNLEPRLDDFKAVLPWYVSVLGAQ